MRSEEMSEANTKTSSLAKDVLSINERYKV